MDVDGETERRMGKIVHLGINSRILEKEATVPGVGRQ